MAEVLPIETVASGNGGMVSEDGGAVKECILLVTRNDESQKDATDEYSLEPDEFKAVLAQFSSNMTAAVIFTTMEGFVVGLPKNTIKEIEGGPVELYEDHDNDGDWTSVLKFPRRG